MHNRRWRLSAVRAPSLHRRTQASPEATMDSDHFDALVRAFSEGTTRRRLTRLLGGLALGALLRPLASAAEKGGNGKGKSSDGTPAASGDDEKPATPDTSGTET